MDHIYGVFLILAFVKKYYKNGALHKVVRHKEKGQDMNLGHFSSPRPQNEAIKNYRKDPVAQKLLLDELRRQSSTSVEVPLYIGSEQIVTKEKKPIACPHNHTLKLGVYSVSNREYIDMAINAAVNASATWSKTSFEDRAAIFLKAAELLAKPYRYKVLAATMLNQSKTPFQAEIDAACELIDFWRFNVHYMEEMYRSQPPVNAVGHWNRLEYRPLEGFIFAVTPFNFTSIGANLPTAPAMMGNTVVWKPASTAVLAAHYIMQILKEAGLPDGVINMIPGKGSEMGDVILNNKHLAGIHFTGSTGVFNDLWFGVGQNVKKGLYKSYPRIVGETGGKDFIIAYKDADSDRLSEAMINGAFEYQGQKCSAASRAYIPRSIWPTLKEKLLGAVQNVKMGDIAELDTFMGAVIDSASFKNIVQYIEYAKNSKDAEIISGGSYDDSKGYFIEPTIVLTTDAKFKLMEEEIFGPVLTIYLYEDEKFEETLKLVDETSPYALTGAIFATDRAMIRKMSDALVNAAGNFYINDKPTGAAVGQQPFGGSRASGTNDKAGSQLNLIRWVTPRTVKERFV